MVIVTIRSLVCYICVKCEEEASLELYKPRFLALGRQSRPGPCHLYGWGAVTNGLVEVGFSKHLRVEHGQDDLVPASRMWTARETFWVYGKTRLVRFRRISKITFYLPLKECEFRLNHQGQPLYELLPKEFRKRPLPKP